ncbi:hypothetical protein EDB19DRAFT_616959 [Suillus lakei]|nr:hypothetical protein EDB19DRAFT_616959 [Suillus lakei]
MAVSGIHSYSTTIYSGSPREVYYINGSIDAIFDRCKYYFITDGSTPAPDANTRGVMLNNASATASWGLRVIAMDLSILHVNNRNPVPSEDKTNLVLFDPPTQGSCGYYWFAPERWGTSIYDHWKC